MDFCERQKMESTGEKSFGDLRITKLNGSDNYISWRRNARIMLEWHDLDAYLDEQEPLGAVSTQAALDAVAAAELAQGDPGNLALQTAKTAAEVAAAAAAANDATTRADRAKKSKQANARLMMVIDQKLHDKIGNHTTAISLWQRCALLYRSDNWLHKARIMGELATLKLANCESMEKFIREHTTAMCRFAEAGFKIDDEVICGLIIFRQTPEYESFVGGLDGSNVIGGENRRLTSETLKRRLIDADQAKQFLNGKSNASSAFKASPHYKPAKEGLHKNNNSNKQKKPGKSGDVNCYTCGEKGHKSFQCSRSKPKSDAEKPAGGAWQASESHAFHAMAALNEKESKNTWFM